MCVLVSVQCFVVQVFDGGDGVADVEVRSDELASPLAQLCARLRRRKECLYCLGEGGRVTLRYERPGAAREDEAAQRWQVKCHHGYSTGERFQRRQPEPLGARGEDEQVRGGQEGRDVAARAEEANRAIE